MSSGQLVRALFCIQAAATAPLTTAVGGAGVEAWVESSLARVMPQTMPRKQPAGLHEVAAIHLAGNEHESFQLALRPAANDTYAVSWTPLKSGLKLSWEQVGLVYVYEMMENTDGPAGRAATADELPLLVATVL